MQTLEHEIAETATFAGLEHSQLEFIAGCARNQRVPAGTVLMREGEPADSFFLIRKGAISLELHGPTGPLVIQTLHDGEVVGWSWLFEPYRWHMDGRAVEDSALVIFDAACLRGKVEGDHELGYQLMSRFAASLIDRLQATRFQLLDIYGRAPA
ncbi:MAG TPA: cyclic nucleotide-binding domain-containing protein [Solirubrobacteraceae bacterium]|nr:cyclic nucleotide-binding domain-containing protein [Solirubrobacteraceae bacterium]